MMRQITRVLLALALIALGAIKFIAPPEGEGIFPDALLIGAASVEALLGAALLIPELSRWAAWGTVTMVAVYGLFLMLVVYRKLPVTLCGCIGGSIEVSLGMHLVVLGALGLCACFLIWRDPSPQVDAGLLPADLDTRDANSEPMTSETIESRTLRCW